MISAYPKILLRSDLQITLYIKLTLISPHQHFGFNWKSYAFYIQSAETVYEKANIFYLINGSIMKVVSLKAVVI